MSRITDLHSGSKIVSLFKIQPARTTIKLVATPIWIDQFTRCAPFLRPPLRKDPLEARNETFTKSRRPPPRFVSRRDPLLNQAWLLAPPTTFRIHSRPLSTLPQRGRFVEQSLSVAMGLVHSQTESSIRIHAAQSAIGGMIIDMEGWNSLYNEIRVSWLSMSCHEW